MSGLKGRRRNGPLNLSCSILYETSEYNKITYNVVGPVDGCLAPAEQRAGGSRLPPPGDGGAAPALAHPPPGPGHRGGGGAGRQEA